MGADALNDGEYRLLRDRRYITWLTSDVATGLAATLSSFAIPLVALAVTGSSVQAGIIGAVSLAARVLATLAGGVLADRHNRFWLMVVGGIAGMVIAASFTVLAARDVLTFAGLLCISLLLAVRGGIFEVAGEAAIKNIVPDRAMGRAQAANQARNAALGLAGAPLGGALLAVGAWLVATVMAVCHAIATVMALILRRERATWTPATAFPSDVADSEVSPGAEVASTPSAWSEVTHGIAWMFARPDLRGVAIVATVVNLGFTAAMTTVTYSLQIAGVSPQAIGVMGAVINVVMLAGAALSPLLVTRVSAGVLAIAGLSLATVSMLALPLVTSLPAIAAVLAGGVLLLPAINAGLIGYMTVATPTELLGRVNSALSIMAMGAMPLAPVIAGFGLEWVGRTGTLVLSGAICVVAVVLAVVTPALRALPKESRWLEHAEQFSQRT